MSVTLHDREPAAAAPPSALPDLRADVYRLITLGCKLNQFDSAVIEGALRRRGLRSAGPDQTAGVVVINTCTVTANADREARQIARRARRENPGCTLIVAGCYAELDGERLAAMPEIDTVVGRAERSRLPEILDGLGVGRAPSADIACIDAAENAAAAAHFGERTRAFLKIQEGCDLSCSYCIIPKVRGASRSVPAGVIARALASLVARGFREVVLTGVNTGDYGKDLDPRTSLEDLLARLVGTPGLGRLRLNSLEPRTVTPGIIALLAEDPRLARHLQVPLQSGSDRTLKRMYRNYRTDDYRRTVDALRRAAPEIGLGADVIVGFPGETDAEFEETVRFISSSPLNYLHVFSYSDRPGTPASSSAGKVLPAVVRERSARLRALGARLSLGFRRSFLGRDLPVLVLDEPRGPGRWRGLTDNFIDLEVACDENDVNAILPATIERADEEQTLARARGDAATPPRFATPRDLALDGAPDLDDAGPIVGRGVPVVP